MTFYMSEEDFGTLCICEKCRRNKYCSKRCKANQNRINAEIVSSIYEKTGLGKILSHLEKF